MINFITQHWIAIAIYLIGCILAYGRINAFIMECKKEKWYKLDGWTIISMFVWTILSWIGFIFAFGMWEKGDKFFKWLPIVLVMFCIGCSSYIDDESYIHSIIQHKTYCHYNLTKRGGFSYTTICAPCGTFKIGDKPLQFIVDTIKN